MKTIYNKQLNQEFRNALEGLNEKGEELIRIDLSGKKYAVLKEEDYRGWRETAYLLSSSKNSEILQKAIEEPIENCRDLKDALNKMEG